MRRERPRQDGRRRLPELRRRPLLDHLREQQARPGPGGTKIGWRIRKHDLERFIVPAMNLREGSNKANA